MLKTENWSKSRFNGKLSIESFSPYPKNPLLASIFVNIGRADTLGSGMRNLYKYTRLYSHAEPVLTEGDVFKVLIPLRLEANRDANMKPIEANGSEDEKINDMILSIISEDPHITQGKLAEGLGVSRSTIQRATEALKKQGLLERIGGTRGYWKVNGK